ncbi:GFA family protein [uncultured Jannaschia sp.]|uniref:GFA family protein n=1 Tax=uncultured Jannaschia sp. TaxID=293347 RepID=UPI00262F1251|nr:GFA family protein [uncultured Jannaschia sp.]
MVRTGGCLCGQVKFRVIGRLRPVVACHCEQCKRTSGNYVAATSAPQHAVSIWGEVHWYQSSDVARRGFCPTCGANLFWDGPGQCLSIMAGALDKPTGLALIGHIFCREKGDWYDIPDGERRAPENDPAMTAKVWD